MALCNHISTSRTNVAKSRATQSLIVCTLCTQYYARRFIYIMRYICVFNIRILTQILVDILFFEYKMYYTQYIHTGTRTYLCEYNIIYYYFKPTRPEKCKSRVYEAAACRIVEYEWKAGACTLFEKLRPIFVEHSREM